MNRNTWPELDIDVVNAATEPSFLGVKFDSKPAALRQLLLVEEITAHIASDTMPIGLDIGSKYQILGELLSAFGVRTIRLDIERRTGTDDFVLGDGQGMPIRSNSMDFVVLSHVLTHVNDVNLLLSEVARILKPQGSLFILQSNRYGWWRFWARYLRRNDQRVHQRAFDVWNLQNTLALNKLGIVKWYCPYYFYLHSKLSDFFYRVDRRFASKMPRLFATQWIVIARKIPETSTSAILVSMPNPLTRAIVVFAAAFQALAVKALELALRVWYRPGWGGDET